MEIGFSVLLESLSLMLLSSLKVVEDKDKDL